MPKIDFSETLDKLSYLFKPYGLLVEDNEGNYRDLNNVLMDVKSIWNQLDKQEKEYFTYALCTSYNFNDKSM